MDHFSSSGEYLFPESLHGRKVLLATESIGPINGVSRTTTSLIQYLQQHGVDVKIVAPHYVGDKSRPPLPVGPVRRLGGLSLPYSPELSVAYPFRLDRISARFKPDLVYLASPASVGFQAMLQMRCFTDPAPVIANFQTDLSAYSEIIFPAPLDRYAVWMLQVVQGYLFSHRSVQTIFYPSSPIANYLVEAGVQKDKLMHLGRGVDTSVFNPEFRDERYRRQLAPKGEIILLCVGRLAPEKGFGFLAKAAIRLAEQKLPFKLVIVGGNRNVAVENEVRSYFTPIRDRVIFTGFLEGAHLARAYASADVFCHCSITETFGLVVLEAMACGLPVVARNEGGPSEIVRHQTTGFLIEPENLDAFVAHTKLLASDPSLREEMSTAGRVTAEHTTWEKINNRVAWRIVEAIEQHENSHEPQFQFQSQILNWIYALGATVLVEMRLTGAMLLVSCFWVWAVFPLMVHGNTVFRGARKAATELSVMNPISGGMSRPSH
ncbi:putative glycosyl transferase [Trichodelitschia bisporula]|uniref:Putative glycosyl transferase n=1 Tax=Trichodelitschia bisporula TaxID=703511 RepID=A0A6G1I3F6_9PEZI|nr:putative glycosyl transferase [Trichodelitschia bisporula]